MAFRQVSNSKESGFSKLKVDADDSPISSTTSSSKFYPETFVDSRSSLTSSSARSKPQLHSTGIVLPHYQESVTVTVRFRPLGPRKIRQGEEVSWYADGKTIVRNEHNQSIAYAYDRVLGLRRQHVKSMMLLLSMSLMVLWRGLMVWSKHAAIGHAALTLSESGVLCIH